MTLEPVAKAICRAMEGSDDNWQRYGEAAAAARQELIGPKRVVVKFHVEDVPRKPIRVVAQMVKP